MFVPRNLYLYSVIANSQGVCEDRRKVIHKLIHSRERLGLSALVNNGVIEEPGKATAGPCEFWTRGVHPQVSMESSSTVYRTHNVLRRSALRLPLRVPLIPTSLLLHGRRE